MTAKLLILAGLLLALTSCRSQPSERYCAKWQMRSTLLYIGNGTWIPITRRQCKCWRPRQAEIERGECL